jgi:hypothetical protein
MRWLEPEVSGESRAFADIGSHWIDLAEFVTSLQATEVKLIREGA